jgi:hypothetical protein
MAARGASEGNGERGRIGCDDRGAPEIVRRIGRADPGNAAHRFVTCHRMDDRRDRAGQSQCLSLAARCAAGAGSLEGESSEGQVIEVHGYRKADGFAGTRCNVTSCGLLSSRQAYSGMETGPSCRIVHDRGRLRIAPAIPLTAERS